MVYIALMYDVFEEKSLIEGNPSVIIEVGVWLTDDKF